MRTEKLPLIVTVTAPVAGVVGWLLGNVPVLIISGLLTIVGAIWQYRISQPFVRHVAAEDWMPHGPDELAISIPASQHHHGPNVTVTVYEQSGSDYEVVMGDVKTNSDGNVTVIAGATLRLVGKVVIA